MTGTGLCSLDVDGEGDHRGGVECPKCLERQAGETGPFPRWYPDPLAPVVVVERRAFESNEEEGLAVGAGQTATAQMLGEELKEDRRSGHRPVGVPLRPASHHMTADAAGALVLDRDSAAEEVDVLDPEAGALAPTQAEDGGDTLSEDELIAMLMLLIVAGHETTVSFIGNGVLALLRHPDQLARLQAEPTLITAAVEELLRYDGPVETSTLRYAMEEVKLGGVTIPPGGLVLVVLTSANRDERYFDQPDTLDITRTENRHLAFGYGIHFGCGSFSTTSQTLVFQPSVRSGQVR